MKRFIGIYHRSNAVTYLGIFFAVMGMVFLSDVVLIGDLKLPYSMNRAMLCLVLAGICDLFDGVFARRFPRDERTKAFGVQLDSLADTLSFVALPVCMLLKLTDGFVPAAAVGVFYAFAGISRLAWFNITHSDVTKQERTGYYDGVPVTYAALIIPGVYIVHLLFQALSAWLIVMMLVYAVLGAGFILNVRIAKPRGVWYGVFILLAAVYMALLIML